MNGALVRSAKMNCTLKWLTADSFIYKAMFNESQAQCPISTNPIARWFLQAVRTFKEISDWLTWVTAHFYIHVYFCRRAAGEKGAGSSPMAGITYIKVSIWCMDNNGSRV